MAQKKTYLNLLPRELLVETTLYLPFIDFIKYCKERVFFDSLCNDRKYWPKRAINELRMTPDATNKYFDKSTTVEDLINKYIDKYVKIYGVNLRTEFQARSIDIMTQFRDPVFAEYILNKVSSKKQRNEALQNFMATAINTNNIPLLQYAIEQKPLKKNLEFEADYALQKGNLSAFKELLPHVKPRWSNWIFEAARIGYQDIVDFILDKNDNNVRLLNTAFDFAILGNHLDLVKHLIKRGVNKKKVQEWLRKSVQEWQSKGINDEIRQYLASNVNNLGVAPEIPDESEEESSESE